MCLVPPILYPLQVSWVQNINIIVPRMLPIPLPDLVTTPISSKLIYLTCLWALCPLFLTGAPFFSSLSSFSCCLCHCHPLFFLDGKKSSLLHCHCCCGPHGHPKHPTADSFGALSRPSRPVLPWIRRAGFSATLTALCCCSRLHTHQPSCSTSSWR